MTFEDRASRDRIVALALLGLVLVGFWLGPAAAYVDLIQTGGDEIDGKAALLQRYRGLIASSARPVASSGTSEAGILMPDLPESQAAAQLQETVKSAAAAAQVQIRGFQVLRSETLPGAIRFGVRVRATGDVSGMSRLLYAIAAARPLLVADNLQVQSRATPGTSTPAPLEFQFDISGFRPGTSL
jgi:hypothetical protein